MEPAAKAVDEDTDNILRRFLLGVLLQDVEDFANDREDLGS
jgi:hypothetical protein